MVGSSPESPRRLPHSSSVLRALDALDPPSPILSSSPLQTACTSGSIPILFIGSPADDSFFADDSPAPLCSGAIGEEFKASESVDSLETVETTCTFGPVLSKANQGAGSRSTIRTSVKVSSISDFAEVCLVTGNGLDSGFLATSDSSHSTSSSEICRITSRRERSVPVRDSTSVRSVHTITPTAANDCGRDAIDDGQSIRYIPLSPTFSALSTPSFALPSPSPSIDTVVSCPASPEPRLNSPRHLRDPSRKDGSKSLTCLRRVSPGKAYQGYVPLLESSTPELSGSAPSSLSKSFGTRAYHSRPEVSANMSPTRDAAPEDEPSEHVFLPKELVWLKDVAVELWIDQEGFRAIQPSFKLMGYSSQFRMSTQPHVLSSGVTNPDDGALEFMPTKRQTSLFHYALFDGPPVLRRITVNGDESRDYISRQASLALKSNGVYSVHGTETSAFADSLSNHGSDPVKLKWKFDYVVDDRRAETTGKIMDGEKTFTPLAFSCSPVMLHSLQGKKITLMHIVRKSVIPNLTAEKLEPPKFAMKSVLSMSNLKTNIQATTSQYFSRPHAWNKHRRAESHVVRREEEENLLKKTESVRKPNSFGGLSASKDRSVGKSHPRRRRASSAGDENRRNVDKEGEYAVPSFYSPKHIVPRSRLCELLSENAEEIQNTSRRYLGPHNIVL